MTVFPSAAISLTAVFKLMMFGTDGCCGCCAAVVGQMDVCLYSFALSGIVRCWRCAW